MSAIGELSKLCGPSGPLTVQAFNQSEFDGLLKSGINRFHDAGNTSLAAESRFDLIYNAAHALSLAALRRLGYRARHRYIVFQVLPITLGLGPATWRVLDKCHQHRNLMEYEGSVGVDHRLLDESLKALEEVVKALELNLP